ncbi:MAG: pilus assembly protein TadG-related protein [Pyrinomonadaceae bacterium]
MFLITWQPSRRWSSDSGSVTVMTACVMLGLVLVMGLSIDVSRIYMMRAGLQNAANAAALAAARELNSGTTGLKDADTQARAAALNENKYGFSREGFTAPSVVITSVEFSTSNAPTWYASFAAVPAGSVSAIRYVRVTTQATSLTMLLAGRILGATQSMQAQATAGMSPGLNTVCDYVPLAVAKTNPVTPFATGTELTFQFVSAQSTNLVNQNLIVLQTDGSEGANKTRDAVAGITPICTTIGSSIITSTSQSAEGNNGPTQIEVGMNARMDQYSNGMKASDAGPDNNVFEAANFAGFNWQNYKSGSPTQLPRLANRPYASDNRRIVVMPIVETGPISGSVRVKSFGAFLFLRKVTNPNPSKCNDIPNPCGHVHVEYLGDDFVIGRGFYDPTNACTSLKKAVLYQ